MTQLQAQLRAASTLPTAPASDDVMTADDGTQWHRLPKALVPEHYDIIIKSDLDALTPDCDIGFMSASAQHDYTEIRQLLTKSLRS